MCVYECKVLPDGNRSASTDLMPMLDAWAAGTGLELFPGTLNTGHGAMISDTAFWMTCGTSPSEGLRLSLALRPRG